MPKAQALGAKGLLWIRFDEQGQPESPVAKFLPTDFLKQLQQIIPEANTQSTLFIIAGSYQESWTLLGRLRLAIAQELNMIPHDEFHFSWITDFPMFEYDAQTKSWNAVHHPFTRPKMAGKANH